MTTVEQLLDLDAIQEMLQVNVLTQLKRVVEKQIAFKGKKKDFINSVAALDIVQVSQQHIRLVTYTIFKEKLTTPGGVKCANLKAILRRMCLLNGLWQLNMDCKACYESGYFQAGVEYSSLILEGIKQLCREIRPDALKIVECYELDDNILQSAIGNSYGDIYETHLRWAKESRLNKTKLGDAIPDGWMETMQPLLNGKL